MPIRPGEYADLFRAIGRVLEQQRASALHLVNHDAFVTVSWMSRSPQSEQRHYQDHQLDQLRQDARENRGQRPKGSSAGLTELLRTLGQELDAHEWDVNQIVQLEDGLVVSGTRAGQYVRCKYFTTDLAAASRRHQRNRATARALVASGSVVNTEALVDGSRSSDRHDEGHDAGPLARRLGLC
jgi:hypothetical protein